MFIILILKYKELWNYFNFRGLNFIKIMRFIGIVVCRKSYKIVFLLKLVIYKN